MDWNPNERGEASKASTLFPSHGRVGKKFAGSSNQGSRRSYHQMKMYKAWRRVFKKMHGRWPSDEEAWASAHQRGGFGQLVDDFVTKSPSIIVHVGLTQESKDGLAAMQAYLDEKKQEVDDEKIAAEKAAAIRAKEDALVERWKVRNRVRTKHANIPKVCIERVHRGDAPHDVVMQVFSITRGELDALIDAYFGE